MKCFVDTGGFAALYHRTDSYHAKAKTIWAFLREKQALLYTSRDVLSETLTLVRRRTGIQQALICGEDLWASPVLEILRPDARQDQEAWDLFRKYHDKDLSFVDCLSFVFMREYRIHQAFTFDRHFTQAGFEMVEAEGK